MRRRDFISLIGGAPVAWPLAARAQQTGRARVIGMELALDQDDDDGKRVVAAFEDTLKKLGWTPGDNAKIEYRWGATNPERAQSNAAELVKLKPDVIVAHATIVTRALFQQDRTIPIVFTNVSDPIGERFVKSFAQPGGRITGFTNMSRQWEGNTCSCSRKWCPMSRAPRCSLIRNRRQGAGPILPPRLKPQVRAFRYRRSSQRFTMSPRSSRLFQAWLGTKAPVLLSSVNHSQIFIDLKYSS